MTVLHIIREPMLGYRLPHKIEEEIMGRIEQEAEKY